MKIANKLKKIIAAILFISIFFTLSITVVFADEQESPIFEVVDGVTKKIQGSFYPERKSGDKIEGSAYINLKSDFAADFEVKLFGFPDENEEYVNKVVLQNLEITPSSTVSLGPQESKQIFFSFVIPDNVEPGTYKLFFTATHDQGKNSYGTGLQINLEIIDNEQIESIEYLEIADNPENADRFITNTSFIKILINSFLEVLARVILIK